MSDSILDAVKKVLLIAPDYTAFDQDIILHINSSLMFLNQLGIGPTTGFLVEDNAQTWFDFLGNREDLAAVKSYVYLRVRLLFDPPSNAFLVTAIESQIREYEWRLNVQAEGILELWPTLPLTEPSL